MLLERFPDDIKNKLKSLDQPLDRHPEKTVYNHMYLVEKHAEKFNEPILSVCAVFHDLGKIDTIQEKNGKNVFYGHELETPKYIKKYKSLFSDIIPNEDDWEIIEWVCLNHMKAHVLQDMRPLKREKFYKHEWFPYLLKFGQCDDSGRGVMPIDAK